jgi:hypothetical protein
VKSLAQLLAAPQSVTHTPSPAVEPVVEAHIPETQALPVSHAMPAAKLPGAGALVAVLESPAPLLDAAPESAPEDEDWPDPASTLAAHDGTAYPPMAAASLAALTSSEAHASKRE